MGGVGSSIQHQRAMGLRLVQAIRRMSVAVST